MWRKEPTRCKICTKAVYVMDPQINLDGSIFHKQCAKCKDCNCQINLSNFNKSETADLTFLLCKTHYFQRFNEGGGCYLGDEKYKSKQSQSIRSITYKNFSQSPPGPAGTTVSQSGPPKAIPCDISSPQHIQVEITSP